MQIFQTKHFAISLARPAFELPRWYKVSLRIGIIARKPPVEWQAQYRYVLGCDFQLIPNFIWWQDVLGTENGKVITRCRIIGIQNWPFQCGLTKYD